jgi:hypothetical protein
MDILEGDMEFAEIFEAYHEFCFTKNFEKQKISDHVTSKCKRRCKTNFMALCSCIKRKTGKVKNWKKILITMIYQL